MSTKHASLPETYQLPSLKDLVGAQPLHFPTVSELAAQEVSPDTGRKLTHLYELLGPEKSHLEPLMDDYQRDPAKYGPETHGVLERLLRGVPIADLTDEDRRFLSLATLDFLQPKRSQTTQAVQKTAQVKKPREVSYPTELPDFWWTT